MLQKQKGMGKIPIPFCFKYLVTNKCYWLNREYDETKAFALTKKGETTSKIYGEEKNHHERFGDSVDLSVCFYIFCYAGIYGDADFLAWLRGYMDYL